MRTSIPHPLRVAVVTAGPEFGRIGITFCPGKYDLHGMRGAWDRDLVLCFDDGVRRHKDIFDRKFATAGITDVEQQELAELERFFVDEEQNRDKVG